MDVRHDWKALNEVLFQGQSVFAGGAQSLVILEDEGFAVDGVVSDGRAFEDAGAEGVASSKDVIDGLAARYGAEQALVVSKKTLDQLVTEAAGLGTNYFQQLQSLREGVKGRVGVKHGGPIVSRRHFFLEFLTSWGIRRLLPRKFNALVFIDQRPADAGGTAAFSYRALLLTYTRGQLDQFFEPDFSSLHENRLENWRAESKAVGQYLESRYILPCYGIFMHKDDWRGCLQAAVSDDGRPWRLFVRAHDNGAAAVYPNGFLAKTLLALQRIIVYFSRV